MKLNIVNAHSVLKRYLGKTREDKYKHSKRVAVISALLAQKWDAIIEDSIIIALLHDIGKSIDEDCMLNICVKNNLPVSEFELEEAPIALHGKISSLIFEKEFKGNNSSRMKRISRAISSHVAGGVNMNQLEKIIFIADNIDGKEDGMKLLSNILRGKINNPDECIKIIIRTKNSKKRKKRIYTQSLLRCYS